MAFTPAERFKDIKKSAIRRLYESAPPGSINMGLGEPDFQTPAVARHAAIRAIEEEKNGYTSNAGIAALRERIALYHNEGLVSPLTSDSVCVTNGSAEALFAVVMTMVGPGDEMLLPDPCYVAYPTLAQIAGANIARYAMPAASKFAFDRENFRNAITEKTKLVFVLSPSNPTGRVIERDDLKFIANCLMNTNAYVVSDEIYRDLYFDRRPSSIAEFYDRTIIISGLSKMMSMTGWRLGWAAGPDEVIKQITVMHQYISTCASAISQKAALAAFTEEGREATAVMRDELRHRRRVMAEALQKHFDLPYVAGEGAFYMMLDVSRFGDSEEVALALLNERVITVPGSAFGRESEGYLRLSFSIAPDLIEEGIRRIAAWIRDQGSEVRG